jgi:hypothetical protein
MYLCFLFLQPILVYMSKVDGKFMFSPVSVNFLTEATKIVFAIVMLLIQVYLLSLSLFSEWVEFHQVIFVPLFFYIFLISTLSLLETLREAFHCPPFSVGVFGIFAYRVS